MDRFAHSIGILCVTCLAGSALAADQMKPGLWEMTIKPEANSGMPRQMPKMSPEQRKKMEAMGLNVPEMRDGLIVNKMCVTKEMAAQQLPPEATRNDKRCVSKNSRRTATGYSADIVCDSDSLKGEGKVVSTISGNESMSMVYDFNGTSGGKPVHRHHETSMKYLAADCGSVKAYTDVVPEVK
jgi:hypothetical protein